MIELFEQWDQQLFMWLNSCYSNFWDIVMWNVSKTFVWVPLYAFVVFLVFQKYKLKGFIPFLGMVLCVTLTDQVSVHLFKEVFQRYRPCHNLELSGMVHLVNNKCGGQYGFVSSHAANTFGFAALSWLFLRKRYVLFALFFWAALVSYSRIYLGVHYPADVFFGALLGIVIASLVYLLISAFFCRILKHNIEKNPRTES